ncbi:MAG: SLBB domain-containing protein [Armatimonadetes bacterium]|nr:SLBB domain-containing protein [Armatimonadota bacterium]MDE2206602.1 SLBB domain-containing protein [Armatimonadota bacterium]
MKRHSQIAATAGAIVCLALAWRAAGAQETPSSYRLGAGDVIEVTVPNYVDTEKDLDQVLTVLPDGTITYPEIGRVVAAGITPEKLGAEIQTVLSKTRNNADVLVIVKEVHSRKVSVVGAVHQQGQYDLGPGWRVMDAIAAAGGLSTEVQWTKGRLIRGPSTVALNLVEALALPNSDANPTLRPGDLVILDQQDVHNQVHVLGAVARAGAYDLEQNMTLFSLLSEAGGASDNAALKQVYVLRNGKQIPLDLYPVLAEGRDDPTISTFTMHPGDTLFVPVIQAQYAVMGDVLKPAYYTLPENPADATLLKALSRAGGQSADADLSRAVIIHTAGGQNTTQKVNIAQMLQHGDLAPNLRLAGGDVLFIPPKGQKRTFADFFYALSGLSYLRTLF